MCRPRALRALAVPALLLSSAVPRSWSAPVTASRARRADRSVVSPVASVSTLAERGDPAVRHRPVPARVRAVRSRVGREPASAARRAGRGALLRGLGLGRAPPGAPRRGHAALPPGTPSESRTLRRCCAASAWPPCTPAARTRRWRRSRRPPIPARTPRFGCCSPISTIAVTTAAGRSSICGPR